MPYDPFAPDTGLKEDFDGVIESALFVQNDSAAWQLQLVIKADDGDEITPKYNLGAKSGVVSYDGGETVSPPRPNFKFNNNVSYWKFMQQCFEAGAGDVLRERSEGLYDNQGPFHANLWKGLRFHYDVIMDTTAREPDPDKEGSWRAVPGGRAVMIPTKYLGSSVTVNAQPSLMDAADEEAVKVAARMSDSWKDFAETVSQITDANGQPLAKNRAVMAQLADQSWYESLKAGV
jgi:hypothetical protein